MPLKYWPSSVSKTEYGSLSGIFTVRASSFFRPATSIVARPPPPRDAVFGLMIRLSEKIRSSAVTVLPLWNSTSGLSLTTHSDGLVASNDSASTSANVPSGMYWPTGS